MLLSSKKARAALILALMHRSTRIATTVNMTILPDDMVQIEHIMQERGAKSVVSTAFSPEGVLLGSSVTAEGEQTVGMSDLMLREGKPWRLDADPSFKERLGRAEMGESQVNEIAEIQGSYLEELDRLPRN